MHIPFDEFKWNSPDLVENAGLCQVEPNLKQCLGKILESKLKVRYGKCGIGASSHVTNMGLEECGRGWGGGGRGIWKTVPLWCKH